MDSFAKDINVSASPFKKSGVNMNVSTDLSPILIANSTPIKNVESPSVLSIRSPLQDCTNYYDGGGNRKSESLDTSLKNTSANIKESDAVVSSQHSTPRKLHECDTESDTTAEYESAGEASPWEKQTNFSSLAERLAKVHLSTPRQGVVDEQARLEYFPFSPISAEDESDEEIAAIISNSPHTLFNENSIINKDTADISEGRGQFFKVSSPLHSITSLTRTGKAIISSENTDENSHQRNTNEVISPSVEFQDAGPACSFHSELMNSIGNFQNSGLDNLSLMSNKSLIGEACRHAEDTFNTSHVLDATKSCRAIENALPESVLSDSVVDNKESRLSVSKEDFVFNSVQESVEVCFAVENISTDIDSTKAGPAVEVFFNQTCENIESNIITPFGKPVTDSIQSIDIITNNTDDIMHQHLTSDGSSDNSDKIKESEAEFEKDSLDNSLLCANDDSHLNKEKLLSSSDSTLEVGKVKVPTECSDNLYEKDMTQLMFNTETVQNVIFNSRSLELASSLGNENVSLTNIPDKRCGDANGSAMSSNGPDLSTENLHMVSEIKNKESTETISKTEPVTHVNDGILETDSILEINEEPYRSCDNNKSISLKDILLDSQPISENKLVEVNNVSLSMASVVSADEQSSNVVDMNLNVNGTIINEKKIDNLLNNQSNSIITQINSNLSDNVLRLANEKHPTYIENCPEAIGSLISPKKLMSLDTTKNCVVPDECSDKKDAVTDGNVSITEICTLIETTFNDVLDDEELSKGNDLSKKLLFDSQNIYEMSIKTAPILTNEATEMRIKSLPNPLESVENKSIVLNNFETESTHFIKNVNISVDLDNLKTETEEEPFKLNESSKFEQFALTNVETQGTAIKTISQPEVTFDNFFNLPSTLIDSESNKADKPIVINIIEKPLHENNLQDETFVPENFNFDMSSDASQCQLIKEFNKISLENHLHNNDAVSSDISISNNIINSVMSSDVKKITKPNEDNLVKMLATEAATTSPANILFSSQRTLEFPPSFENENSNRENMKSVNECNTSLEIAKTQINEDNCLLTSAECGQGKRMPDINLVESHTDAAAAEDNSQMLSELVSKGQNVEEAKVTCPDDISDLPIDCEMKQGDAEKALHITLNTFDNTSKYSAEKKSYEDLLDKCSEQEMQLDFDTSIKSEADKIADELESSAKEDSCITPQPNTKLSQEMNTSEAGPTTADEEGIFEEKEDTFFEDATKFDFDFLSKIRGKPCNSKKIRESLFLRFDPLASNSNQSPDIMIVHPLQVEKPDSSSDIPATPKRIPLTSGEEKLISLTPCQRNNDSISSSTNTTPLSTRPIHRFSSGQSTPVVRHDFLAREISKLQDLMVKQEATHEEQIGSYTEALNELQEKNSYLEEQMSKIAAENNMLIKSCSSLKHEKELLLSTIAECEKLVTKVISQNEADKNKYNTEVEELAKERDKVLEENEDLTKHLVNMEIAFNDVHQKYEKCKDAIELFKQNEEEYKISLTANQRTIMEQTENYRKLKDHASDKLEKANLEISKMTKAHESELAKERACAKKLELRVKSLEEALEQKKREMLELNKICDDLITKMAQ